MVDKCEACGRSLCVGSAARRAVAHSRRDSGRVLAAIPGERLLGGGGGEAEP
jgi:hypothetical protein